MKVAASISDCDCVVAGGIGWGARDQMTAMGITPIVTTLRSVEDAARACATGEIENIAQPLVE
jgi:predicted Fe-Mo cluster-binding NifX family protein